MHYEEQQANKYGWLWAPNRTHNMTTGIHKKNSVHMLALYQRKKNSDFRGQSWGRCYERTIKQKPLQMGDQQAHKLNTFLHEPSFEHNYNMR